MTGRADRARRARRIPGVVALWLAGALSAAAGQPLTVQIVTVTHTADQRSFTMTGAVASRDTLAASFPASGRIAALSVSEGDHVAKGAVLARLDSVQQEQALLSARAALSTARANAAKAREDANRQDALLAQGATTRSARDAAANQLLAAEAGVAQAKAEYDRAKTALGDTVLHAPADATVTGKMAELGQVVGADQPILKLALGDKYDAIFQVPEALPARFSAGAGTAAPIAVTLSPVDRPGETIVGHPRLISPIVDSRLGTVKVTVSMPSLPAGMRIGDPILGSITLTGTPRVLLPWSAITSTEKGPAVWVVDPATHKVSLHQVTVLRYDNGKIVLSGGLKDGEEVVGLGANLLYPGRAVRPAEGG